MYAVIAKYSSGNYIAVFKSFNRSTAETFFNNAKSGRAGIRDAENIIELKFATIEAKSNATQQPFFKETDLLKGEIKDKSIIDGHRIIETIETFKL